ncbi:MAG TPA: 50S ribosomal protein L11 methyltransferase [Polyangiaceae bacterium]|nr:50S ribosomal protein L11 methyltransferase [Polyangiaceae bacterium]
MTRRPPTNVAPRWQIVSEEGEPAPGTLGIRLLAGGGFGDGTHPTTALCLQALSALAPRGRAFRLLDFGSGSGILAIAAALHLGARVDAVEISPAAIEHAERNFSANGVSDRIRQLTALPPGVAQYDFVIANILRPVLIANARELTAELAPGAVLVLSGLVSTDVPEVRAAYAAAFPGSRGEVYASESWRALVFHNALSNHERYE